MRSNTTLGTGPGWNGNGSGNENENGIAVRTGLAAGVTTLAVLAVAFGAMALGIPYFWVVFPVGFGGVLPVVVALANRTAGRPARSTADVGDGAPETDATRDRDDALRTLRDRYARGQVDEVEFERRLERLLETETVDAASRRARSRERLGGSDGADFDEPERVDVPAGSHPPGGPEAGDGSER